MKGKERAKESLRATCFLFQAQDEHVRRLIITFFFLLILGLIEKSKPAEGRLDVEREGSSVASVISFFFYYRPFFSFL